MNLIGKIKALFKRKPKPFYSTISLQDYVYLQRIISEEADDYVKMQGVVRIIKGVDIDTLPIQEAQRLMEEVTEQLQQPLQYDDIRDTYKFGDYTCTVTDADNMTMGQFMDYQSLLKEGVNKHLVEILSVLLVPKGSKYSDGTYDLIALRKHIASSPVDYCISVVPFVQRLFVKSLKASLRYSGNLILMDEKMNWKQKMERFRQIMKAEMTLDSSLM